MYVYKHLYIPLGIQSLQKQYDAGSRLLRSIITLYFKDQSIIVSAVTPQSFSAYCTYAICHVCNTVSSMLSGLETRSLGHYTLDTT